MQNKIQKLLEVQAERNRQALILGAVLFFAAVMSVGTIEIANAANTANSNVAQNVTGGSLDIDDAPDNINFTNGALGADNSPANTGTNDVQTNDTRGTLAGWSLTGYFATDFWSSGNAYSMAINDSGTLRMFWDPENAVISEITGDAGGAVAGTSTDFSGIASGNSLTLMNSNNGQANKGAGAYNLVNLVFLYDIPDVGYATSYTTTLTLTIA
ncbi:hypothetical protein A2V68_00060 [candidate division Kazan bacterium RBG_13_50_9]|uniref:WxL domain-containing protein n=1 Tax=candidate division Kazan bacterium RBG_13_50_9 TaxID=1798535 RepID=A0A1F4NRX1_UNCK3|nr:MAG: hypothetical protein A2V68_00060 [candidate division Kazan bacterium RBG_13_50_9]